jgi:Protein of unknown function (DUF1572)
MNTDATDVVSTFTAEARKVLGRNFEKIVHCLEQLSDDDVNWRPFAGANSIGNIITHLCGNVGQWIVSGVGGEPDRRNRPGEFARELHVTRDQLVEKLKTAFDAADATLAAVTPDTILARRKIQGFDETVLSAIFQTVSHFEGHTHQIVYITRVRLGDRYVFKWVPSTPEQISAAR